MKKHFAALITSMLFSILFFSCATTLNVNLTRPAKLDLNGAKTIAVLPIKPFAYYREYDVNFGTEILINTFYQIFEITDPDEAAIIQRLRADIENGLVKSPYIKLVNSGEVERARRNGYLNPADVYLTGEIAYFSISDKPYEERRLVKEATETEKAVYQFITYWTRYVDLIFRYQIVSSSDNCVISTREIRCSENAGSYDSRRKLPSAYSIVESKVQYAAKTILKELQPYTVTKSIKLLETKSKDKLLKERMKAADSLASENLLEEAKNAFSQIYEETALVEAGYNAAIIEEARGNLSIAESMMMEVYNRNPDSRVAKGLEDIRYEIEQATRLNKQIKSASASDEDL